MKPKIETMKTRASHISVRTIAVVLCFVMLIGAIGAGSVLTAIAKEFEPSGESVLADAALKGADVTAPADEAESDDNVAAQAAEDSPASDNAGAAEAEAEASPAVGPADKLISRIKDEIADTGADVDYAGTGWTNGTFKIKGGGPLGSWGYHNISNCINSTYNQYAYDLYLYHNSDGFNFLYGAETSNKNVCIDNSDTSIGDSSNKKKLKEGTDNMWFSYDWITDDSKLHKVRFIFQNYGWDGNGGTWWEDVDSYSDLDITNSLSTAFTGSTYSLGSYVSTSNLVGTATYSYSITAPNGTTSTSSSWTPEQAGTYTIEVTSTDNGVVQYTNALDVRSTTESFEVTVSDPEYYIGHSGNSWGTSGDPATEKFTANGDGTYSLTYSFTDSFAFLVKSTNSTTYRMTATGDSYYINDADVGGDALTMTTGDARNMSWHASNYYSTPIKITFNPSTPSIKFELAESYYVANNISLTSTSPGWNVADPLGAMTRSSGTTWTKEFTGLNASSSSSATYKFRIADGTNCVTVSSHTVSGNVLPAFGAAGSSDANNVIFTLGATDTSWNVTITYDSSDNSVTVNAREVAEEEASPNWKYTADNTDAEPEITDGSTNALFLIYDTDDDLSSGGKYLTSVHQSGNDYWCDLTDVLPTSGGFWFGLNNSSNTYDLVQPTTQPKINGTQYSGNDGPSIFTDGTNNLFKADVKERDSKYYIHLSSFNSSNYSSVGVLMTSTGSGGVNYKFYYKGVGSGSSNSKTVTVYAKDGTITDSEYGFGKYADTTISDSFGTEYTRTETDADDEDYYTGSFTLSKSSTTPNTLTVTTTVGPSYKDKFYVKGWCVNGETYGYNATDTVNSSTGVYTLTLPVAYDTFDGDKIEITPIYYLVGAVTVSFRVENFVDAEGWGNTIYAYPFYGALSNVDNSYGAYPGQPLIYYQGKYSIQIPIESLSMKDSSSDGTIVRGITLNNGYFDNAHKLVNGWTSTNQHKQTYDFDDFYKIYNEKNANDIIFRFKYRATDTAYNRTTYFDSNKTDLSSSDISTLAADKTWEVLRDRAGRIIDIFGNPIQKSSGSGYATSTSDIDSFDDTKVWVISMGYFDNNAGEYATEWVVYKNDGDGTGTRIQYDSSHYSIVPSALLLNNNTRFSTSVYKTYRNKPVGYYKDMYDTLNDTSTAKGKPAVIAYERDQLRTNNAYRSDGRWYYTTSSDYVQSNIKIQYKTPAGTYVDDTYSDSTDVTDITGVTTGAKAYFTNLKYANKRQSDSEIYSDAAADYYTFKTRDGDNYQFAGWYIEVDGDTDHPTYTEIKPDANGNYSVSRTSSDVLVARFDPIKAGNVNIYHEVATGIGTVDVKVEYGTTGSYTTLRDFAADTSTLTEDVSFKVTSTYIKATNSTKNIKITLKTIPGTDNTFSSYTASDDTTTNGYLPAGDPTVSSGVYTKEITISISDLLNNNTAALTYYSNMTAPTYKYEITYTYTSTRLKDSEGDGAEMTYTSKGTMTADAYANNVTITNAGTDNETRTLSNAFISSVAPHESNFNQIMALNLADIDSNRDFYTSGTNTHTQTVAVHYGANEDAKQLTGRITLPYLYTSGAGASSGTTAYQAKDTYQDYSSISAYSTMDAEASSVVGILEDYSSEPFNIYTVFGGYFVTGSSKTSINFYSDDDKKNVITAPLTILGSEAKEVTKYTIDTDSSTGTPIYKTWADYTDAAYETEIKRILGVENLEDNEENRATVKTKYTYTKDGIAYKCYRVSTETHYVPDGTNKYFQYWSLKNTDQVEVARCYFNQLSYLAYESYNITAVYGTTRLTAPSDISTSISYLGASRNQWNYNGGDNVRKADLMASSDSEAADYIWEDFAVDFQYKGEQLNTLTGDLANSMKMGVVIQKAGDFIPGTEDTSAAYRELYKSGESTTDVENYLKKKLFNDSSVTVSKKYNYKEISRANLSNKNREDYYLRIANSYDWNDEDDKPLNVDQNYSKNVLRVYSYFIIGSDIYVSEDPAYFCTNGIANDGYIKG